MSDAAHWPYSGGATGQPQGLDPNAPPDSNPQPCPFGQGYAKIAGLPKRILVTQPAAGAEWLYKHTGPSWILLRSITWRFVTSAAVATLQSCSSVTRSQASAFQSQSSSPNRRTHVDAKLSPESPSSAATVRWRK